MKKILAFTAIRSEYDLLSNLYILLHNDQSIELKLIVSGAHLSKTYGYSIQDIEKDGLDILMKIETLLDSDSKSSRIKQAAILMQNIVDVVAQYNPDLIIYAGDREEVMVAALVGGYLEIPTMHFFGGDHVKDSHIDNPIRHATSKLSTIHMVSTKEHYDRLVKMGESVERIYNIGSVALDKFIQEPKLPISEIENFFNIHTFPKNYAILIFHPIPKERETTALIFENILNSLEEKNIQTFVSYPNIDPGNKDIVEVIERYKKNNNFKFYKNLPRNIFVSLYKNAQLIIGNSSSGILESASIPIPAINVGYRQTGRKANENVIFTGISKKEISVAIEKAFSIAFQEVVQKTKNIYGDGYSSKKALEIIKHHNFKELLYKDEDILEIHHA